MTDYTIKDKVAIVGIGETRYYKAGQSPVSEFQLALEAIQKAVADAGLRVESTTDMNFHLTLTSEHRECSDGDH